MNSTTIMLLVAGLFIAWIIGPAIVLYYRVAIVPRRSKKIRDRFLSNNPGETLAPQDDRQRSGALRDARLRDPDANLSIPGAAEDVISRQFWHFHGWNRYWLPLTFVIVPSGSDAGFLWVAIQALQNTGRWRAGSELVLNVLWDWKALQRRVLGDVKPCTVHDCRKTFCTHAADLIPIQTLAEIVGDTVAMLTRFYTKAKDEHADTLRKAFDDGPARRLAV